MRWHNRLSVRFLTLGLALAVVALGASGCYPHVARMQRALEAEAAFAGMVGAWQVVASPQVDPGEVSVLLILAADGSVVVSDPGQPAAGLGAWKPTGPHRADLTYLTLVNGDDGTLVTIETSASLEYDPRTDTISGRYTVTATDPGGAVVDGDYGQARGTRIVVEAPALPAATPTLPFGTPAVTLVPPVEAPAAEATVAPPATPAETPTAAAP